MATIKLFGSLRGLGAAPVNDVPGQTVRAAILALCAGNKTLKEAIFDGEALRAHVRVMVNGRDIELADGLETPLTGSNQVAIFPPIAGGDGGAAVAYSLSARRWTKRCSELRPLKWAAISSISWRR